MTIDRIDPPNVHAAPGLIAQVVALRDHGLAFISGQVSWDASGDIVGVKDYAAQIAQVLHNLDTNLQALGVGRDAIVKETIYVVGWTPELLPIVIGGLRDGGPVPASTLIGVASLAHPDALVEVDVVVAIPRE